MRRGIVLVAAAYALLPFSARAETGVMEKLTLDQAVARALERHPNVRTALAEVRRVDGVVMQIRATALPTLQLQVTNTLLDKPQETLGFLVRPQNQLVATAPLFVPLVAPRAWAEWSHALNDEHVAELNVGTVRRGVAISVANAYLTVVVAQRALAIENTSVENAQAHANYTKQQLDAGTGNQLDAVRAAQQLHTSEAQRQRAIQSLVSAQAALGVLVAGESPIDAAEAPVFPLPSAQGELSQRADIQEQEMRRAAASKRVRDIYVFYLPQITASVTPVYTQPHVFAVPQWYGQFDVSLVFPIFDGGDRYGVAKQRRALFEETNNNLENTIRTAKADVQAGFQEVEHAEATVKETHEAAALAEKALQIALLRYREGATTNIEVIDAEQQARNAGLIAAQAEDNARIVRLNLLSAAGGFPK